ncbi:unnamed protein product [Mycena citricolor]|uniref:DUF6532 domain-containing protein n=1 Tax=Mycena citricolor TaxID=2018698 RepID=A0AAD2Q4J4_9AGAR|nr:unnamed protein product [Mycena citricolor]
MQSEPEDDEPALNTAQRGKKKSKSTLITSSAPAQPRPKWTKQPTAAHLQQAQIDSAAQAKLVEDLQRKLAKEKRKNERIEGKRTSLCTSHHILIAFQAELNDLDNSRLRAESEERDEPQVQMSSFSGSFRSKGIVGGTKLVPVPAKHLYRAGEKPVRYSQAPAGEDYNKEDEDDEQDEDEDEAQQVGKHSDGGLQDEDEDPFNNHDSHSSVSPPSFVIHSAQSLTPTPHTPTNSSSAIHTPSTAVPPSTQVQKRKSTGSVSTSSGSQKRRKLGPPGTAEKVPALKKVQYVNGHSPARARTNASDFVHAVELKVNEARHIFAIKVYTINGFPTPAQEDEWVDECWFKVNERSVEKYELIDRVSKMYTTNARTVMITAIRPLIPGAFNLRSGLDAATTTANEETAKRLIRKASFHYKDTVAETGFIQGPIIHDALKAVCFPQKKCQGVEFASEFSPIRVETLALLFTIIEFLLREWEDGTFTKATFDETEGARWYKTHLGNITDWNALLPASSERFRQALHDTLRQGVGAARIQSAGSLDDAARARALAELEAMNVNEPIVIATDASRAAAQIASGW